MWHPKFKPRPIRRLPGSEGASPAAAVPEPPSGVVHPLPTVPRMPLPGRPAAQAAEQHDEQPMDGTQTIGLPMLCAAIQDPYCMPSCSSRCTAPPPASKFQEAASQAAVAAGGTVEYWSATQGAWIAVKVVAVNPDGSCSLDCGPDMPPHIIWRQVSQSAPASGVSTEPDEADYKPGDAVEYMSSSQKAWVPARVISVGPSGTLNLSCKPDAPPEKVRRRGTSSGARGQAANGASTVWWFSSWGGTHGGLATKQEALPGPAPSKDGEESVFSVGENVQYWSKTQGAWIPAKVLSINPDGTYKLDCKPDAPADRVQRLATVVQRQASSGGSSASAGSRTTRAGSHFKVGDFVEYSSATVKAWIPAVVLAVNDKGTYNLDCKPDVLPEKLRLPEQAVRSSASGDMGIPTPSRAQPRTSTATPGAAGHRRSPSLDLREPVQLLAVQRTGDGWAYRICPRGAELLARQGARPMSVASFLSLQGAGKRSLLAALSGCSGRPARQEPGLWLCGLGGGDGSPLLALLDCEGFGSTESDHGRDAQVMALCVLLSSVLVLGTKLAHGLSALLALGADLAKHVEEQGDVASRPELLWLLCGFRPECLRGEGGAPAAPEELLERAFKAGGESLRGRSATELWGRPGLFRRWSCATLVPESKDQHATSEAPEDQTLCSEFLAGVEALHQQLVNMCQANPKTIGGQPLTCYCFTALLTQFVEGLNNNKCVSVKRALEAVQHEACARLVRELRGTASRALRALASGGTLQGGAQLPLSDEALGAVLRDRRRLLRHEWDERAVGDEAVRRECWLELKEAVAVEEATVRQRNAQLADQQLLEMLGSWQAWLEDDTGASADGEQISKDLGQLMQRMPSAHALRVGRAALEVAARRVSAARTVVVETTDQPSKAIRSRTVTWDDDPMLEEEQTDCADDSQRDARAMGLQCAKTELQAALQDVELEVKAQVREASGSVPRPAVMRPCGAAPRPPVRQLKPISIRCGATVEDPGDCRRPATGGDRAGQKLNGTDSGEDTDGQGGEDEGHEVSVNMEPHLPPDFRELTQRRAAPCTCCALREPRAAPTALCTCCSTRDDLEHRVRHCMDTPVHDPFFLPKPAEEFAGGPSMDNPMHDPFYLPRPAEEFAGGAYSARPLEGERLRRAPDCAPPGPGSPGPGFEPANTWNFMCPLRDV